jgi:hypothetical protein
MQKQKAKHTRTNLGNSSQSLERMNAFDKYPMFADLSTGTTLALVNEWSLIGANAGVILLRVLIEFLILKIRNRKRKDEHN